MVPLTLNVYSSSRIDPLTQGKHISVKEFGKCIGALALRRKGDAPRFHRSWPIDLVFFCRLESEYRFQQAGGGGGGGGGGVRVGWRQGVLRLCC